jgi:uncharacterized protein
VAHPNVELLHSIFQAYTKGDMAAIRGAYADNVVLRAESAGVLSGTYSGVDEVMSFFARVGEETNGTWRLEPLSVIGDDDHVVSIATVSGQRGGESMKTRQIAVNHFMDGKIDDVWLATEDGSSLDHFWS